MKIIIGDEAAAPGSPEFKGVIECMWETFGGAITPQGYKLLDSHVGLIYGDGITTERQQAILEGLKQKGFASYNVILGLGSFTYEYVTRDSFGFAMKATYGEVNGEGRDIFKSPKTDDGTKLSAKGLLQVYKEEHTGKLALKDSCSWEEEGQGELKPIFRDGKLLVETTLAEVRERIKSQLSHEIQQQVAACSA